MARKSFTELRAQAAADLPDNVTGLISPADVRNMVLDVLTAIQPAYGTLSRTTDAVLTVNIAPAILQYTTASDTDPTQTTSNIAGTIARAEKGTSRIYLHVEFEAPANREIHVTVMADGVDTDIDFTATGRGANNIVAASLVFLHYSAVPTTFSLEISADQNGVTVTSHHQLFAVELVPVDNFV